MGNRQNKEKRSIAVIGLKGLPAFGGAATVGENIIKKLHHNFDFTVFSVASHADKQFKLGSVKQHIFKSFPIEKLNIFCYYIKSCFYVLFCKKYDLIHLHHTDGAFILPLLRLRYKVILTSHAQPYKNSKWPWYVKLFFMINGFIAIKLANEFTVVSKELQKFYKKRYNKVTIYIPNGVDINLASLIQKGKKQEDYLLFAAGRVIPLKGLHLLLQAMHEINYKGKLKVVGNLDQMPVYKKEILELTKGLDVEFIGLIKDKIELLSIVKAAKLFVFPSSTEAMSIMLLEAAMVQTPILCSDIPANTNVFTSREVSFFKSGITVDLVSQLKHCLNHQEESKQKSLKAYSLLQASYTWERISQSYQTLFDQV